MKRFPRSQNLVINIRGTNGSGKSTIATKLLTCFDVKYKRLYNGFKDKPDKVWGYEVPLQIPIFIIGPYETPTGGCDCISDFDFIFKQVELMSRYGHVVFEGALLSTLVGRFHQLSKTLGPKAKFIAGVMDTPFDKCVARVNKRRARKGKEPIDPARTMQGKYNSVLSSSRSLEERGVEVRPIPYQAALGEVLSWLFHVRLQ